MKATDAVMTPALVVRAYLVISGLFTLSASVIWGVNTLFLLDAGLDIFQVFVANSAFTVGTILFEIPTGVVADTTGRRRSFLLSTATLMVGTLAYVAISVFGGGLALFAIASLVLGIGFCFYSGAVEAWLVDALPRDGLRGPTRPDLRARLDGVRRRDAHRLGGWRTARCHRPRLAVCPSRPACWGPCSSSAFDVMHDIGFTPRTTTLSDLPDELRQGAAAPA